MLPATQFGRAASLFAATWAEAGNMPQQWTWVAAQHTFADDLGGGYLCLNNIPVAATTSSTNTPSAADAATFQSGTTYRQTDQDTTNDLPAEACDPEDSSTVVSTATDFHLYTFHIVYLPSYNVPVLLFSVCQADGDPLTWHELVADLPQQYQITALQPNAKWTFIAHVEHPHLFVPWYMLHPCQSSELLKLMLEPTAAMTNDVNTAWSDQALSRYMAAWFTLVGQVFKLKLKIS